MAPRLPGRDKTRRICIKTFVLLLDLLQVAAAFLVERESPLHLHQRFTFRGASRIENHHSGFGVNIVLTAELYCI